ncbi:conjugal transfer protein [Photorhabdus hainanensis]|uniref:conjugal transfer protein n=1 Tax=Photorhabdus hainanensis TaxID=1004166 RepID=UPI001BD310FA|nr:conjugal transfer protein [Photorhabdus hainanensis]MBS9434851.1 conjugal transfer protein [Photorhabdus hainanensis]
MNLLDIFAEAIAKKFISNDTLHYADLATIIGLTNDDKILHPEIQHSYILTTENTEYLSVVEIIGAKSAFGTDGYREYINNLATGLSHIYSGPGHKISLFFERDCYKNNSELNDIYHPHIVAMERLNVDLTPIIKDEAVKLSAHYAQERCYLVLYTSVSLLDKEDREEDVKRISKELEGLMSTTRGQNPLVYTLTGLKILHDAVFWQCINTLKGTADNGLIIDVLDVKQVGNIQKTWLMPDSTPKGWEPRTIYDKNIIYDRKSYTDEDNIFPANLKSQVLTGKIDVHDDIVECDNWFYKSSFVEDMPLHKVAFQKLFREIPKVTPYRIKYDLIGGCDTNWRSSVLSVIRFIPSLKNIADDLDYIEGKKEIDTPIRFAIEMLTWGRTIQEVKRNSSMLSKAVQGWGISTVSDSYADPVVPFISSIPALAQRTTGEIAYSPLSEALHFLPFERPASVWAKNGIVFYLTEDGKLFPYRIASNLQLKHTEMITGTPGSGKSVLANRNNLALVYLSQKNLPFATIVDKGLSAKGIYDLLSQVLPPEKRHQIAHIILENSRTHRVNFLETQLGSRYLTTLEKTFVVQMLSAFCIDPEKGLPPNANDINSVLNILVDLVYEKLRHEKAKLFEPSQQVVNEALERTGILKEKGESWLDTATWFDVEDVLFDKVEIYAATIAHRYAMPVLDDFQSYLSDAKLTSDFEKVNIEGSQESVLDYIGRSIRAAVSKYPILSDITNYDYNAQTRIVIIDMMNVLGANTPEGQLQSGIMYLFARHLATKNYYLPQCTESFLQGIHPRYRKYHEKRIAELSEETKHTFYDECHNFKDIKFIQTALNTADLEDRKFGVRTVFSSQYVQHMPESVVKSVNTLFMMRLAEGDKEYLDGLGISIPGDVIKRFNRLSAGAARDGSGTYFLAVFKTIEGNICHILKNTVGTKQLWALTSNMKDRKLRELLYKAVGVNATLDILAERFPTSTADPYLNSLSDSDSDDSEDTTMIEKLAKELIVAHSHKGAK